MRRVAILPLIAALAFAALAHAGEATQRLEVVTASGSHAYEVEIANDEASRELGLMNRRQMATNHGMLFEFQEREPVAFWMRNTYLSLDMVFIDADGTVRRVVERATPLSDALIPSGAPVTGVLELNAGQAAAIRLKPGDRVVFPSFFKK